MKASEQGDELRSRLKSIRTEEKRVQNECEKAGSSHITAFAHERSCDCEALEAVKGKGNCQEQERFVKHGRARG